MIKPPLFPDLLQALFTIHQGHVEVQKNIIGHKRAIVQKIQCFTPIACCNAINCGINGLQGKTENFLVVFIVIDKETRF